MLKFALSSYLLCLAMLASVNAFAADVYKSVDEHGNVTYSDSPKGTDSKKVEIKESNSMPAPIMQPSPDEEGDGEEGSPDEIPSRYQVSISSPSNDEHLPPGTRHLTINVNTDPELHASHTLQVTDNGSTINGITINHIAPGTHTISAKVVDNRGKILGQAPSVAVHVHRVTKPRAK